MVYRGAQHQGRANAKRGTSGKADTSVNAGSKVNSGAAASKAMTGLVGGNANPGPSIPIATPKPKRTVERRAVCPCGRGGRFERSETTSSGLPPLRDRPPYWSGHDAQADDRARGGPRAREYLTKLPPGGFFRFMPPPDLPPQVAAAVVNFQTPDLLDTAVRSFHHAYPQVPLCVIDNGSQDDSPARIRRLAADLGPSVQPLFLDHNHYHGPALHLALTRLTTPFVYLFDSDTETQRGGFLEAMLALLPTAQDYGAGQVVRANQRGFRDDRGVPVLASAYMLLNRTLYHRLPPFIHHGLPVLQNCTEAARQGYRLHPFPIETYVTHFGRGTAERYGYGLGWRSRLDYLLHKLGL